VAIRPGRQKRREMNKQKLMETRTGQTVPKPPVRKRKRR
jgi:hypothetical protein